MPIRAGHGTAIFVLPPGLSVTIFKDVLSVMKTYNRRRPQKVPEEGERFRGDATQSSSQAFDAFLDNPEDPYYLPSDSDAPEAPPKVVARQCTKQASSAQAVPKQQRATRPPSATLRQNRAVISAPFAEKKPRKATGDSANAVTENSTGEIASTTTSSRAEQEGRKRKEPATCSPAISEVRSVLNPSLSSM